MTSNHIEVGADKTFALSAQGMDYRFHVDAHGELVHDHFGSPAPALPPRGARDNQPGWGERLVDEMRELPDHGRGDFRLPAVHIRHGAGHTVTAFEYASHEVVSGKPTLPGLPATFGKSDEVTTLLVKLVDAEAQLEATLSYSVFPKYNAVARSFSVTNKGTKEAEIQRAASFVLNLEPGEWDMTYLAGDWSRETRQHRQSIHMGTQGFQSSTGYSSHYFNPFVAITSTTATENQGEAYGLSFIYSGSFSVDVEKFASERVRAMIGLHPLHLSWKLAPGETFTSPEAVAVYSPHGLGGMSRNLHGLFQDNLSRSPWTQRTRPVLLNSWEGMYFDFDADKLYERAKSCAELGVRLFVMDDGWFGDKHPRLNDTTSLGDWVVNKKRFPDGLDAFVQRLTALQTNDAAGKPEPLKFGIWFEPEMVSPQSELYEAHPDWCLHAGNRKRTECRSQLVLDLSRREVQDYIIETIGNVLASANIGYVKWDNNRPMHEMASPSTPHAYMLGLYRVLDSLTTRFPDILWEGCASGGGRFDPGILHYWPQSWTSDDTDGLERIWIQWGTSLAYPASSMGAHVSACPNHQVQRTTPLEFRAHVALMGGSFGFELDVDTIDPKDRAAIPELIALSDRVAPLVVRGSQYRLAGPETNRPAVMYVRADGAEAVLLAFQMEARIRVSPPALKLEGLEADATYDVEGTEYTGAALMASGLRLEWQSADYQSQVLFIKRK